MEGRKERWWRSGGKVRKQGSKVEEGSKGWWRKGKEEGRKDKEEGSKGWKEREKKKQDI